jgi:VWFA-related protein
MTRIVVVSAVSILCTAAIVAQQPQAPATFRSAVEAVQIDVYVTDVAGNPVSGLTMDDFELLENGTAQDITTFQAVDIPIERAPAPDSQLGEPDVLSNDMPLGRVYLFVLDEVEGANILRTRRFVRQFIEEHFGPNDLGAIALTGRGLATDGQDFTNNRRLLLNAIDRYGGTASEGDGFHCQGPTSPTGVQPGGSPRLSYSQQAASLRSLSEMMARIPGRHKAMLFFTQCIDFDALDLVDYNGGVLSIRGEDAHAAMAAATRSNMAIYPIDPSGVTPGMIPLETKLAFRSLGEATGGFALIDSNSFTETFERIVRENSTYYMLAFNSAYYKDDGKYVRVQVKVKRPDLIVHARAGYVAPTRLLRRDQERATARAATSAVSTALASPLATSGVPMRVFAAPFKGRGKNASVALALELDAASLGLEDRGGVLAGKVDVRFLATDAKRNVYPEIAHTATVEAKPEGSGRVPLNRARVRIVSELELPAGGRYQLRVAAGSAIVAGNVVYDLEVPDFSDGPLVLSGVALVSSSEPGVLTLRSSKGAGRIKGAKCYSELCSQPLLPIGTADPATPAAAAEPWLEGRLPGPPTAVREFAPEDDVVLVGEVYDNARRSSKPPATTIAFTATLRAPDGRILPLASQERAAAANTTPAGHTFQVPLAFRNVPEGEYSLRVQARSSHDLQYVVTREIPIRVR